jgi:putative transposase
LIRVRPIKGRTNEEAEIYRRADNCGAEGAGGWCEGGRPLPQARISEATFYNWKAKYGGLEVSEAKRLKALEDENARLKKLLAEQMLDAAALRELLSKKW